MTIIAPKKGGARVATPLVSIIPTGKARQSQVEGRVFARSIKSHGLGTIVIEYPSTKPSGLRVWKMR